jgi:hypothetical protein
VKLLAMARLRRTLGPIAAAWLFCQVATVTTAPVVFWIGSGEELLECTCSHGDHATCPMHHKPAPGSKVCPMRSAADDSGAAVLTSLLTGVGLLADPADLAAPASVQTVLVTEDTRSSLRPAPPDPPPPRV